MELSDRVVAINSWRADLEQDNALTVLIVEDEPDMVSVLKMLLERKFSATVEIAEGCASAREKLESGTFDIITLDYQLPDGDGLELLQEIQAMDAPPPVVMVTGHGDEQTAAKSFKLGASGYVVKDKRLQTMVTDAVEHALSEEELKRAEEQVKSQAVIIDQVHDSVISTDLEGFVKSWNKGAERLFGYTAEEALGKHVSFIYPEDRREFLEKGIIAPLKEKGHHKVESDEMIRKSGERFYAHLALSLLRDSSGEDTGMVGFSADITERKRAEKALVESEENLNIIFDSVPGLIFYKDRENNFIKVNRALADSMGFTADEIEGKSVFDFFPQEQAEAYHKDDLEVIESGVPKMGIIEPMETPEGARWLRTDKIPYRDAEGNIVGIIGFAVDITERIKAEEEIRRINAELEGFAHTVSHDLKGPLSAIMLGVDMLAESLEGIDTKDVQETSEIVAIVDRNARNAQRRIEDLLALAEAGQVPRETSSVDVREVVEGVLEERSHQIKDKGIEVDVSGDLGIITGSPTQVRQVFSNLIGNAITHNDSENPVVRVSYLGDDSHGGRRYLVRDNGPGIPEEIIDKVFIPFTKGDSGDTGIGLSIVERIVKVHSGEIRAYNDSGACFEFTLRDFQK